MLPEGAGTMLWFHEQLTDSLTDRYDLCDEDDTDRDLLESDSEREERLEEIPIVTQPFLSVWQLPHLKDFPSSHFVLAEYDPLRDGSLALAKVRAPIPRLLLPRLSLSSLSLSLSPLSLSLSLFLSLCVRAWVRTLWRVAWFGTDKCRN